MYNLVIMKNTTDIEFNKRLRLARKENSLTQQAAADAFGISLRGYCRWEKGEREPSLTTVVEIAKTFNVTTDWLLGLSDEGSFGEC